MQPMTTSATPALSSTYGDVVNAQSSTRERAAAGVTGGFGQLNATTTPATGAAAATEFWRAANLGFFNFRPNYAFSHTVETTRIAQGFGCLWVAVCG